MMSVIGGSLKTFGENTAELFKKGHNTEDHKKISNEGIDDPKRDANEVTNAAFEHKKDAIAEKDTNNKNDVTHVSFVKSRSVEDSIETDKVELYQIQTDSEAVDNKKVPNTNFEGPPKIEGLDLDQSLPEPSVGDIWEVETLHLE